MPIISIRIIKKPRARRRCDECGKYLDGETIRLFGMASDGDEPYPLFLHRECLFSKDVLAKLAAIESVFDKETPRRCRVCGCTDDDPCVGGCYWVEDDLCSACEDETADKAH